MLMFVSTTGLRPLQSTAWDSLQWHSPVRTSTCTTGALHRTLQETEQRSSITGGNSGGYPARCVRYVSLGSLPPFWIRLGTTPGKPLRSFGSELEPQSATNIAWNVLWIF